MRFSRVFTVVFFLPFTFLPIFFLSTVSIASAEIKIKVIDPQEAAVAGAEVQLLKPGKPAPLDVKSTSAEGFAIFRETAPSAYRVQVLAPGFAPETADLSLKDETTTVRLRVATAAETVVVSATRTPVTGQAAGADVETLSGGQLEVMQPVAADDALRFLPGAVVNTYG
ncbi:MAG: carboxypeptidase regulatory-like domain-containing protein, partial [Terriglobales bacterium]